MESLQHAGWEPSPPSKEIMSPAAIKTCTQLDVPITAHGGGRDIFSHRYAPSPTNSPWSQRSKIGVWCCSYLPLSAFSLLFTSSSLSAFQPDCSHTASLGTSVFQAGLEPGEVWDYFVKFSVFPHSLEGLLAEIFHFWVIQAWRTLASCILIMQQSSCFTLQALVITFTALCVLIAKTNFFFCLLILVCFFSVKAQTDAINPRWFLISS